MPPWSVVMWPNTPFLEEWCQWLINDEARHMPAKHNKMAFKTDRKSATWTATRAVWSLPRSVVVPKTKCQLWSAGRNAASTMKCSMLSPCFTGQQALWWAPTSKMLLQTVKVHKRNRAMRCPSTALYAVRLHGLCSNLAFLSYFFFLFSSLQLKKHWEHLKWLVV